jgi:hypothetical protein
MEALEIWVAVVSLNLRHNGWGGGGYVCSERRKAEHIELFVIYKTSEHGRQDPKGGFLFWFFVFFWGENRIDVFTAVLLSPTAHSRAGQQPWTEET